MFPSTNHAAVTSKLVRTTLTSLLGLDRVRLWTVIGEALDTPEQGHTLRGPPSAMIWAKHKAEKKNILIFGTGLGYLVFWQENQPMVRISQFGIEILTET
jgi:hypothetical protein